MDGRSVLLAASWLYLLVSLALPHVWRGWREATWAHVLFIYLPPALYLAPPLALLVTAVVWAHPPSAALNVASLLCVASGVLRWSWHGPLSALPTPRRRRIRVLTYNLFGGSHPACAGLGDVIERTGADLVFMQEAWWAIPGRRTDPLPAITSRFLGWSVVQSGDHHELCILTRFPVIAVEERPLGERVCLVATLQVGSERVRAIDVHLTPPATGPGLRRARWAFSRYLVESSRARHREAADLRALLLESDVLTLVGGDFNSPPSCFVHRVMPAHYRDAFRERGTGCGHTWFERLPLWRLDYIFTSPDIRVLACRTLDERSSDHRPVVADVELPFEG